jgi:hypothetical protein
MSNSVFDFTKADLDQPLFKLYIKEDGVGFTYENVGVTKELWDKCETIDYKYTEEWEEYIDDDKVRSYGFHSLEDFKKTYIRCMIFNSIKYSGEPSTLLDDFNWRHKKAMRFKKENEKYIKSIEESECSNVLDYYMQFSMGMLFSIGW